MSPADLPGFIALCATRPGYTREQAEKRAKVVEWVAFHNPVSDGQPTYFVGERNGQIVAHLGRMPTTFMIEGDAEAGCYFHDLYVHPDLRKEKGSGFFLTMKLYRAAEKASPGICAMVWTNEINIALQKARKYDQMWIDRRVAHIGLSGKLEKSLPRLLAPAAQHAAQTLLRALNAAPRLRLPSGGAVRSFTRFDERFDDLANRSHSVGISPRKDHAYLNWKYVDRPFLEPVCLELLDERDTLVGFCVAIAPDEYRTSSIAELYVVEDDRAGIHALLSAALRELRYLGADRVEAVAGDNVYGRALHERLFRRNLRIPLFLAKRSSSPHAEQLFTPSRWHVCLGDSEGPF